MNHTLMDYPKSLPKTVPAGSFLMHNQVRPSRRQGNRGARFWLQTTNANLVRCSCDWAPELGGHYTSVVKGEAQ